MDAERAIRLSEFMLKTLAVDRGGRRDVDILLTGMPREKVDKMNTVMAIHKPARGVGGRCAKVERVTEEADEGEHRRR